MLRFDILTIFPHIFSAKGARPSEAGRRRGSASGGDSSYFNYSILKRAKEKGLIKVMGHDIRAYSKDKHTRVDDRPFGGGAGMVIKIEPLCRAVQFLKSKIKNQKSKVRTILFSTRGKKFDAKTAKRLSKCDQLILICGRYEGVDERVAAHIADEEISIGGYVLSGGELPAMILVEAVSRYVPGVLGTHESLEDIKGSYPVYTRPEVFNWKGKSYRVPKVLLSGDHKKIADWRRRHGS